MPQENGISFLFVGHMHEDIDARFSKIAEKLRKIMLKQQLYKIGDIELGGENLVKLLHIILLLD